MSLKTRGILVLVIGTIMGLGLSLGGGLLAKRKAADNPDLSWEQTRLIAEVMERVRRDYVEEIDDKELMNSAIRGMVSGLDRHSEFLSADEYREIRDSTSGRYSGVGLEVSTHEGAILVIAPIDDTPAQRAGIETNARSRRHASHHQHSARELRRPAHIQPDPAEDPGGQRAA